MANALTNFVTVGKASFGDFAKSILTDLTGMMIKMAMFNALKTGMSFFLPTGNDPGLCRCSPTPRVAYTPRLR